MIPKIMIIDGQAEFRRLLAYHIASHWGEAIISEYDPSTAGQLPDEFSGAGNDVVLLGDDHGEHDGRLILQRFLKKPRFPAVVYFSDELIPDAPNTTAGVHMARGKIDHASLIAEIDGLLIQSHKAAPKGVTPADEQAFADHAPVKGYRYLKLLATGEHAAVFLAEKVKTGNRLALKVLGEVPEIGEGVGIFDRFLQEYEIIAELDHPNIVQIFDFGVSDHQAHIAMEYLPGGDLKQRLATGVAEADALEFTRQVASALDNLHSAGVLHRDLKPGNIMLRGDGSVALIDFGLAKKMQFGLETLIGAAIIGTPYYMSPEQGRGIAVDERSDLYSLGIILCELLTGKKPFMGRDPMTVIFNHAEAPLPVLPAHLDHHQALVDRLLAKNPANRLQSAKEVLKWL